MPFGTIVPMNGRSRNVHQTISSFHVATGFVPDLSCHAVVCATLSAIAGRKLIQCPPHALMLQRCQALNKDTRWLHAKFPLPCQVQPGQET